MLAEAADRAGAEAVAAAARVAATAPPEQALQRLLHAYLSKEHVKSVEMGCPVAALGSEMPRQGSEVRRAATRRINDIDHLLDAARGRAPHQGDDRCRCSPVARLGATGRARTRARYRGHDGRRIAAGARRRRPQAFRRTAEGGVEAFCPRWHLSAPAPVPALLQAKI